MNLEKNAFILCFSAIIWKRIFSCLFVYASHKHVALSTTDLLKCLKYNLLAETGFVEKLRPYLVKALTNGFLMPKDYRDNRYVKKAIFLFAEAYKIAKYADKKEEISFIHKYAANIFSGDERYVRENEIEANDLIDDISHNDEKDENKLDKYCELIDAWDIDLSLVYSDDPYFNLIKISLLSMLSS